jgi:hypothetical protein
MDMAEYLLVASTLRRSTPPPPSNSPYGQELRAGGHGFLEFVVQLPSLGEAFAAHTFALAARKRLLMLIPNLPNQRARST